MSGTLSHVDVSRLLRDSSAAPRAELAGKLGGALATAPLSPSELALAQDIVRALARDVELSVRAALSESLRHCDRLPRDIAQRLAADVEAVSLPILADSLVLTDEDLIALVRQGSPGKQTAIAGRDGLSESVSEAVVTHAHEGAVATLMRNETARLTEATMTAAVDRFPLSGDVQESLVHRRSLPMAVAERLTALVSRTLRDYLVRNHDLSPEIAADIVLRGRERAVINLSAGAGETALLGMVSQMHHGGRLTPTLVLRAVCTGDIAFLEAAMAVRAGVSVGNAQTLIHDRGGQGLVSLCRKAGLPDAMLPAIRTAVAVVDGTGFDGEDRDLERYRSRVIARVLTQLEAVDPGDAAYLVDRLGDVLAGA